ncbi:YdbL family protein [Neptuniibacter sp. QD37_6]|uniref:YdbL family protein n=1 Tax=Neptuniibacter sp. QD37_6 TaxID=3398210 RepID=UPI0039F4D249
MKQFRTLFSMIALALSIIATPAWAISKDDAKAQGLIGERTNGYLGIVISKPTGDLQSLVDGINKKRRAAYEQGSKKAGVERAVFELRMGQRLQERTPTGQFIQLQNGKWRKK